MMVDKIFRGHILRIAVGITMLAVIATGAAAGTDINSCPYSISSPGEYVLTTNLTSSDTCIYITSSNVTFDGAGHTIEGGSGFGVDLISISNVTVKNLSVTNSISGIYLDSVSNSTLTGNTASSNNIGIDLESSSNNNLTGNNASSNGKGIYLNPSSDNNTLTSNNASSNTYGIYLASSSNNNLTGNNASSNVETGIDLGDSSDNNNLTGNNASSNSKGIYLASSSNNNLTGNNASSNGNGIYLDSSSDSNNLTGNNASSNREIGIFLFSSSNNNLTSNNASSNGEYGILVDSSNNNNLTSNNASSNAETGICLFFSSNNNLTGNNASSNGNGIYLADSSDNNTLADNNASNNTLWAFYSESDSINNTVTNLTINPTISFTGKDVAINSASSPASDPNGYKNISKFINATNNSADSWLFLNVSYSGSDVAGLNESTLRMWRYDGSAWSLVPEPNNVDTEQKYVYANITAFSIFAPMGSLPFNISGYKINDTNGNGIWNSGEKGIQGWNITLKDATGNVINTTATDSAGFYQFTNITAGSYNVTEEDRADWNHTNATLRAINLYQNITNLNFTNRRVFSVNTSTGTGTVYFETDAGDIENLISVNESDLPAAGKPNMQFPHGFLSFNITGLNLNQTVNVTIVFPSNIPITAQYWKYQTPGGWYQVPIGSNDGDNIITIQLKDGGIGDDIGIPDGKIVDPGGVGLPNTPPAPVPALNPAGLVALVGALSFVAISRIRRRGK